MAAGLAGVKCCHGQTRHDHVPWHGASRAEAADAAARYGDSPITELRDLVRFDSEAMDAWYEEDEPVYVHPRDPHTRVDILASSRHVRVEIAGVTVADSPRPRLLFETGLPTRYYLPRTDVRMDLLEHSETVTRCPYKGQTEHFAARIGGRSGTWPGAIRRPCRKARRSRGSSPSTTSGSTRSSTAPGRTDRRHRSASGRRGAAREAGNGYHSASFRGVVPALMMDTAAAPKTVPLHHWARPRW
jgi:uncharacterized protein (DUF427 family)